MQKSSGNRQLFGKNIKKTILPLIQALDISKSLGLQDTEDPFVSNISLMSVQKDTLKQG